MLLVHFVYGRTGSGKSRFMLECASATHGKHIFVLVPDRGAVMAERTFSYAPNAGDIDVVTFSRLSNFVFRRYGGICENYISRGAKKVIMHNTLAALSGFFSSKGEFFDSVGAVCIEYDVHSKTRYPAACARILRSMDIYYP